MRRGMEFLHVVDGSSSPARVPAPPPSSAIDGVAKESLPESAILILNRTDPADSCTTDSGRVQESQRHNKRHHSRNHQFLNYSIVPAILLALKNKYYAQNLQYPISLSFPFAWHHMSISLIRTDHPLTMI